MRIFAHDLSHTYGTASLLLSLQGYILELIISDL